MSIVVAMSGGVDSSTAATLLVETDPNSSIAAYDYRAAAASSARPRVVALTMKLWNQRRFPRLLGLEEGTVAPGHASGRCCSLDGTHDARRVADFLSIPHYVVNFEQAFEERVVRPFVARYLAGETPIPCSLCNTQIKFAKLIDTAREIGAERVATGHYARLRRDEATGRYQLLAGVDRAKDQSYFLFGLTQEQLACSLFPLGELTKEQVRAIARAKKLPVAEKPESQEICFVPSRNYREFIEAYLTEQGRTLDEPPGEIVSTAGRVLGEHRGLHHFTIGQRKGLGVALGTPLYVIEIDRARNRVVVGPDAELFRQRLVARAVNWIRPVAEGESINAHVKVRHKHTRAPARVEVRANGEAVVEFVAPQRAITPGQAAVFYAGDEVLGGGWISRVL
jgi:tRNA-specific 2-thiouridylase